MGGWASNTLAHFFRHLAAALTTVTHTALSSQTPSSADVPHAPLAMLHTMAWTGARYAGYGHQAWIGQCAPFTHTDTLRLCTTVSLRDPASSHHVAPYHTRLIAAISMQRVSCVRVPLTVVGSSGDCEKLGADVVRIAVSMLARLLVFCNLLA
jgi:hypothetical protein